MQQITFEENKIKTGFKIPENYFDNFEERVMQQVSFEQNKFETGFKIPDNYFENFEDGTLTKIEVKPVKVISLWQRKSVWISSVAAIFIIAFGTWFYFQENSSQTNFESSDYLAYEANITTEDIVQHLTDEDLSILENELNILDKQSENYINEYLN